MIKTGVFLSDIHAPDNIDLRPIFSYLKDLKPEWVILGGDIIDASGLHASESMRAEDVKMEWFKRDVKLASGIIAEVKKHAKHVVYMVGNHEERYDRLRANFPDLFEDALDLRARLEPLVDAWIPYNTSASYFLVGDCVFVHGDIFQDGHAKAYMARYNPRKVVYGHLHHFGAYSGHRALLNESPRYSLTAGHLSTQDPGWKKGRANQWVNGFVTFWTDGVTTVPTPVLIEKGRFVIGGKEYK